MDVQLDERLWPEAPEAMDLAGLDHEDLTRSGFKLMSIDDPEATPGLDELYLVIRVTVRPGAASREAVEQEYRDPDIAVVGANEVMGAAVMRQVGLFQSKHG